MPCVAFEDASADSDKVVDVPGVTQQTPTVQTIQKTIEIPQWQCIEKVIDVPVVLVFRVPLLRVMEQTVETLKSQCFEEESTLLADNKLTSQLDGRCAAQAPECEELQRLRAEGSVAICDINKVPNDSDSLELFKETLPSPIMMQVQSDKREGARRVRAVFRNSSGSSRDVGKVISMTEDVVSLFQQEQDDDDNKKTSCLIDIGRAEDADTSLAIDTKSHESAIADPTAAAQHRSTQQHNYHRKQLQPAGQTEDGGKEEKGQGEREKGRKDEGGRGQEGRRKEKERETEVKKDVTDWTVVIRNRRQRQMIQGERVQDDPDGGESDRRQSRGRDEADPERRGRE